MSKNVAELNCGKKARYPSRGEAKKASKVLTKKLGGDTRPYKCDFGDHFHLTSL